MTAKGDKSYMRSKLPKEYILEPAFCVYKSGQSAGKVWYGRSEKEVIRIALLWIKYNKKHEKK